MRKIISSIDIGSDSVKLIVGEFIENQLHILSARKVKTAGIENCKIVDKESLISSIKKVIESTSKALGIDIKRVILGINPYRAKLVKSVAAIKVKSDSSIIDGDDITAVIHKSANGKVEEDYVLLGVLPVEFVVDGDRVIKDPKGLISKQLILKSIVITSPKDYVSSFMSAVEESGLKVVDIIPNCLGDYYTFKTKAREESVGAIINIGNEMTSISIFNRGIITNTKTYKIGAKNIVSDIAFMNKLDYKTSMAVYKDIVLASTKLANPNEYRIVTNIDNQEIKINQYDVSEIALSRIEEILNLAKKQINILTKKEISYIIITGGLTELKDFALSLESVFGKSASIGELNLLGARDNSYASSVGILKYFDGKVSLRGRSFSIFTGNEIEKMNNGEDKASNNNSLLSKVFGYFFDS